MRVRSGFTALCLVLAACSGTTLPKKTGPFTYVAIGASDTVGVGTKDPEHDAWVAKVFAAMPPGSGFVRLGVSGSTAAQAVTEQLPRAIAAHADIVTIWLAVNDLNAFVAPEDYRKSLHLIIAPLRKAGARVFVANVPDLTKVPAYAAFPPQLVKRRMDSYNSEIAAEVKQDNATLVDLVGPSDELVNQGGTLISEDGFHPSEQGYQLLADTFLKMMRADASIGAALSR